MNNIAQVEGCGFRIFDQVEGRGIRSGTGGSSGIEIRLRGHI